MTRSGKWLRDLMELVFQRRLGNRRKLCCIVYYYVTESVSEEKEYSVWSNVCYTDRYGGLPTNVGLTEVCF